MKADLFGFWKKVNEPMQNFKTKEDIDRFAKRQKKKINKWWNLITILIGFVSFAYTMSNLSKNHSLTILFIVINAVVTAIVISIIFKAFEKIPNALIDEMVRRQKAIIEKEAKS